ncbi:MAG: acetate kinase [Lachnospiraceae bacterium]|nr:acetate kinase [Lachnospiraceae bacterium]
MIMKVLVINCGSSSLKFQLIDSVTEEALATGICERIGIDGAISIKPAGKEKTKKEIPLPDHDKAVKAVLEALTEHNVVAHLDEIEAVGHRVVHGGEKFTSSVIITEEVKKAVEECNELAPLHNPANLIGIAACEAALPGVPQVGVFDTAFHQTMEPKAFLYGLPYSYYTDYKIRKYGFHGTSHKFVSQELIKAANLDPNNSKVIVCHLGGGASVTAVKNGKSIDTSMGLTPLEGLIMGTRSGDIDPSIVEFIGHKLNKSVDEVMEILNKKSGVLGLSDNVSSDFRDLNDAADAGNKLARQAIEVFCYRVAKYIGGYVAALGGLDALAFTAGLGENDHLVRELVMGYLGYLGVTLDKEKNKVRGEFEKISAADSKIGVYVIPTNEELAIARETVALVK